MVPKAGGGGADKNQFCPTNVKPPRGLVGAAAAEGFGVSRETAANNYRLGFPEIQVVHVNRCSTKGNAFKFYLYHCGFISHRKSA